MMSKLKSTSALFSVTLCTALSFTSPVQSADKPILEEITVTAQKREQSLQDVPVSVAVVTGDFAAKAGIQKLGDLQFSVPNFTLAESGIGTNVFIRGVGSGNNQGFEQSVGVYIDGIHHGRAQQNRLPFLDVERIEVLRGPQAILFGKNSIAGALNITSAKPTDEFEGSLALSYEVLDDEKEGTLILSGPLSDNVRARLAARYRDQSGYIDNVLLDRTEPQREDYSIRGTIEWDLNENLTATLKVEHSEFDVVGRNIEIAGEFPANPIAHTDAGVPTGVPNPFGVAGLTYAEILAGAFGQDPSVLDTVIDGNRSANGDFSDNEQTEAVLTLDWQIGDHVLTSISGYSDFGYNEVCDCDFTGADVFLLPIQEEYQQFSQEIRLTSPGGEEIDYIFGLFFQTSDHEFADQFQIATSSVLVPALNNSPALVALGLPFGVGDLIGGTAVDRTAAVDTNIYAAFGKVDWNISEDLTLSLGGRISYEEKTGARNLILTNIDGSPLDPSKVLAPDFIGTVFAANVSNALGAGVADINPAFAALAPTFGFVQSQLGQHPVAGELEETRFSPEVKVSYQATDDLLLYAGWTRGFKSGGFDFRANNRGFSASLAESFQFLDEQADNFEIGGKSVLADGVAELNFAVFYTEYKDLQVSVFDGNIGFNVGNAAGMEVYGLELDGRWQLTENLMVSGSFAYLNAEFTDYELGPCAFTSAGIVDPDSVVNGIGFCDFAGRKPQLASDVQGTVRFNHYYPVSTDLALNTSLNVFYTSAYNASASDDPLLEQGGYARVDVRVALGQQDGDWEVAVLAENITNQETLLFGGDSPLAGSTFFAKSTYQFIGQGTTISLQAKINF